MNRIGNLFYRPTENHVGVIYRFGRFNRFVDPDRLVFTFPWIEAVLGETRLDMRTVEISLKDVFTSERIALDVDLKIFYMVDLRRVELERRTQVLRFPGEAAWDEIVRTGINDIARNSVFVTRSFDELTTQSGRSYLKQAMSAALAERVSGFGILVNTRFGVNIVNLQPNEQFRKALMEESAARSLGTAAVSRLSPLLEKVLEQKQEKAIYMLIMQIASAVAKSGEVPDVIFPSSNDYPAGGLSHESMQGSNLPSIPGLPRSPARPRSIAGD